MVSFELVRKTDKTAIYYYYPENNRDSRGVIYLSLSKGYAYIKELAPTDRVRTISVKELNSLRNSANQMRKEEGRPLLTEEEWPSAKKPETYAAYGSHAINKIEESFSNGIVLEQGRSIWY